MNEQSQPLHSKIASLVVERPKSCLAFSLLLIALFAPGMSMFKEAYDVRIWFRDTDPNIKVLDAFERQFGNDENLVLVLHSPSGIFDKESMETLREVTEKTWHIPEVLRVDSLTNYNITEAQEDDIYVGPFWSDDDEATEENLALKKKQALEHKVLPGYLISRDGNSAMIFARLVATIGGSPDYKNIVAKAREMLGPYQNKSDHVWYVTGEAGVNDAFREVSEDDGKRILPILFSLVVFFLIYVFRSLVAMTYPLMIMGASIVMTLGICFYLGMEFNSILSILPGILIAISIADSVHIIVSMLQFMAQGSDNREAAFKSLDKNMIPTFLTSVSTTIGFFSLLPTELEPIRQLGLLAGVGCLLAWIMTIFLLGPLLVLVPLKTPGTFTRVRNEEGDKWPQRVVSVLNRYRGLILVAFFGAGLFSLYFGSKNEINSNPYEYFTHKIHLRQANDFIQDSFGGNAGPEVILYAGKKDGIKEPEFLKKVEKFKDWLDGRPFVNKTVDVVSIVKDINKALNGGREEEYKLPATRDEVGQELFFYSMGLPQGMDLNNRMTLENDAIRMSVLWKLFDTRSWLREVDVLEKKAKEFGLEVKTTGKFLLFQRMMDYVVLTFFKSVSMALVLVSILMMILFRSVKIGLLSLVPNVLPLLFGAAFMKLTGMQLNIGTSLVASVCLGIAVDDTIHFLSNYYRLKKEGKGDEETFSYIFRYTGSALVITTAILVAGFGLYVFGDFIPNVNFGLLCAMVLTSALAVDLIFLPALLMQITAWKRER